MPVIDRRRGLPLAEEGSRYRPIRAQGRTDILDTNENAVAVWDTGSNDNRDHTIRVLNGISENRYVHRDAYYWHQDHNDLPPEYEDETEEYDYDYDEDEEYF